MAEADPQARLRRHGLADASTSAAARASASTRPIVPGRRCGSCTLCCKTIAVAELEKPAGAWCGHCTRSQGCAIYATRPQGCRDFICEWMLEPTLGPEWKPDRAKFTLFITLDNHLSVCVDPGYPMAWRGPNYYPLLKRLAQKYAADPHSPWPAVDVWVGRKCTVILPDGDVDLGEIGANETVAIDCETGLAGPRFTARRFARA